MLELHQIASSYHQRPSQVFGLKNDWVAWQFDRAVWYLGRYVEVEQAKTGKDGKPKRSLDDILNNGERTKRGSLAQLMAMMGTGE